MSIKLASLFILLVLFGTGQSLATGRIENIRIGHQDEATRLVFDFSTAVKHRIYKLTEPHRLVIDIEGLASEETIDAMLLKTVDTLKIRLIDTGDGMRFVLDLKEPPKFRYFSLPADGRHRPRLVLDMHHPKGSRARQATISIDNLTDQVRDMIIAIDAGHGGKDPGAVGPEKTLEKDITLGISKELNKIIAQEVGYQPLMIRDGDYFIVLKKRADKARRHEADLFLSIHADAFKSSKVSGASIFTLSTKKASSETADYLARGANRSDLIGGIETVDLSNKKEHVAEALLDLTVQASLAISLNIGQLILDELKRITKLHKTRVEQASFLVLKTLDMPSLLIETGFISNPTEANKLSRSSFQKEMARSIFTGIKRYYSKNPIPGTLVGDAAVSITVKAGDTLSELAQSYQVSSAQIKQINSLPSSKIKIGQKLFIPLTKR